MKAMEKARGWKDAAVSSRGESGLALGEGELLSGPPGIMRVQCCEQRKGGCRARFVKGLS